MPRRTIALNTNVAVSAAQKSLPILVNAAARGASDLLGTDIVVLDVGDVMGITDHFVIVSASNTRQVRRIADECESAVKADGGDGPLRLEGLGDALWVLIDFGAFVVHVFHEETRRFYDIERLWSDVPRVDWVDPEAPAEVTV
ncbi:MAG: ribosome-associated protein [Candidatus Poriferisodalaceae bacterium]